MAQRHGSKPRPPFAGAMPYPGMWGRLAFGCGIDLRLIVELHRERTVGRGAARSKSGRQKDRFHNFFF